MKRLLTLVLATLMSLLAISAFTEETAMQPSVSYPKKTIEVIVPFNPGGDTDLMARGLVDLMSDELGVTVMVTNMPGGGGSTASNFVKDAPNDGYTVYWCHNTLLVNNLTHIADYTHDAFEPAALCVHNSAIFLALDPSKYASLEEFISYAKSNPGKAMVGATYGGNTHILGLGLMDAAGIDANIVDIGSASNGNIELIAHRIDAIPSVYASVAQYFESGEMLAAGVFSDKRIGLFPDVPTLAEEGYDVKGDMYYGFYFPKGTDEVNIDIFNAAVEFAAASPEYRKLCETYAAEPVFITKTEAADTMDGIMEFYRQYEDLINK